MIPLTPLRGTARTHARTRFRPPLLPGRSRRRAVLRRPGGPLLTLPPRRSSFARCGFNCFLDPIVAALLDDGNDGSSSSIIIIILLSLPPSPPPRVRRRHCCSLLLAAKHSGPFPRNPNHLARSPLDWLLISSVVQSRLAPHLQFHHPPLHYHLVFVLIPLSYTLGSAATSTTTSSNPCLDSSKS